MHAAKTILEYGFSTIAVIIVVVVVALVAWPTHEHPSKDVVVNPFRLLTEGPYIVGQTISMKNGLCNTTKTPIAINLKLGVKETTDPLTAKDVVVLERNMFPLSSGCVKGSDVLTGPLPAGVTPGRWKVYLTVCVQRDCDTTESPEFEVKP